MEYMLTASVMSAPAALLCSKINMPEEGTDQNLPINNREKTSSIEINDHRYTSIIDYQYVIFNSIWQTLILHNLAAKSIRILINFSSNDIVKA